MDHSKSPSTDPMSTPWYLYFVVFSAGMTTLALELSASRLLGSVFGSSNLVWAAIIGLILIYLAVGYFIGGRWADRSPNYRTMYRILAWGAFSAGLVPLAARPVLRLAANAFDQLQIGVLFGSFAAVLILFTIPVTLLGMISPFAIRLSIHDPQHAGRTSGYIYATSTAGSFIGTFLPVLVFIPLVGTTLTFLIFSGYLLVVALIGLWLRQGWRSALTYLWMPVVLAISGYLIVSQPIKSTNGQIYETESAYNYIQVLEQDGFRLLRLNEGQGVHSIWHPTQLDYYGPWEQFLAGPFLNQAPYRPEDVKSMAIIGLAAGTLARQATEVFGPIRIDGFEIDPKIIEVGQKYFDMNESNLIPIAEDGRVGLERSDTQYSLIAVDAYRPPYIPWHLTTREFFQIVHDHLTSDGVLVINVGRSPGDRRLIDGLVGTIQTVFPSVYVMDVPDTFNSIIYATLQPTDIKNLYQNYVNLQSTQAAHLLLISALQRLISNQQPTPRNETVYTDDRAPIEWITNTMVLNFVLTGGTENLK
jgi:spermidine synthase